MSYIFKNTYQTLKKQLKEMVHLQLQQRNLLEGKSRDMICQFWQSVRIQ